MSRSNPKLHSRAPRIHNISFDQLQLGNNYIIEINNHYGKRYYYGEIFAKSGQIHKQISMDLYILEI